jgi:ribosomal protein L11 methylase PrmA
VPGSFRDPAGFVFQRDGTIYRQVNRWFAERYESVAASGLLGELEDQGLLIPHREVDRGLAVSSEAHAVLQPDRVPFVSYPYEWSFSQLKDAALATLRAQRIALDRGATLRDATAYNVQYHLGRPVLIDILSFEPLAEGRPWIAYAQFCRHFLAPLVLMSAIDPRLSALLRTDVDGIPLDLAASLLPRRTRLRPGVAIHLVAHARAQRKHGARPAAEAARAAAGRRFGLRAFRGLVESLERAVEGLDRDPGGSPWGAYYEECGYGSAAADRKAELVATFLDTERPETVWDLGANTGRFSRLAAERGSFTVSLDSDHDVIDASYREVRREGEPRLLPLVVDLANPSPPTGWAHEERAGLEARGPADLVMALALIHHLAIGNSVPLPLFVDFLARIGRTAIVEFVPREDPQVQEMLATREDVFGEYEGVMFERAAAERFHIERREGLPGSERVLYLLRRRS